ncbi:unnamed protein product, partial [Urochloa humidicola]
FLPFSLSFLSLSHLLSSAQAEASVGAAVRAELPDGGHGVSHLARARLCGTTSPAIGTRTAAATRHGHGRGHRVGWPASPAAGTGTAVAGAGLPDHGRGRWDR